MKVFCVLSLETPHYGDSNVISFSIKMNFILSLQLFDFSKGLKNVETDVVNEPSVLEPKKAKTDTLSGIIYRYPKSTKHKALIMKEADV